MLLSEYGTYSVYYEVEDFSHQKSEYNYVISVKDMIPPQVTFSSVKSVYEFGEKLEVANINVSDAFSYSVTVFLKDPTSVIVQIGDEMPTLDRRGKYTVYCYVVDASGNLTIGHYDISVK